MFDKILLFEKTNETYVFFAKYFTIYNYFMCPWEQSNSQPNVEGIVFCISVYLNFLLFSLFGFDHAFLNYKSFFKGIKQIVIRMLTVNNLYIL